MASASSFGIGAVSTASPVQSPHEEYEEEEEFAQTSQSQEPPSPDASQRNTAPLQKRRRVTRACDECRRKKIKCDGKQPCTHCTVYSYECTYDQPSNRRRNPAPQYVEGLEARVVRAEAVLNAIAPGIDLNDPNIELAIQRRRALNQQGVMQPGIAANSTTTADSEPDGQLDAMIESAGRLDLDEDGRWDFHGGSSGMVFMDRMRSQFSGLLGIDASKTFLPRLPRPYPGTASAFDSPKSMTGSPFDSGLPNTVDLPSKEMARALVADAFGSACSLLRFVHEPTFYAMLDRIYDIPAESFGNEENTFLPLLYVALALGCMFHTDHTEDPRQPVHNTYRAGFDQGLKYFRAGRQMLDITDCRDMTSLQAILFMILFLQSTANLSTCYSYIGIALRSALRMGMHRKVMFNFDPIERETRRRTFWVIRKMDTYVSALLGFPHMLSSDDIDQELPIEVDDEYITEREILPMPPGKLSVYAASNAHTRLMTILAKVITYIYPVKGLEKSVQPSAKSFYVVSYAKIKEIEQDLSQWSDSLPMGLRPDGDGDPQLVRVQQLLRLAYAHVHMMLYRPFLHYAAQDSFQGKVVDKRAYECAAACVSVSQNIVHITSEMKKRGLLVGAYWFTMYTTFFAILSIAYYVVQNLEDPTAQQYFQDAKAGKDALKGLAQRSQAADRCSTALEGLFEGLSEKMKNSTKVAVPQRKKRAAPSAVPIAPFHPGSAPTRSQQEPIMGISRATTFPMQNTSSPIATSNPSRASMDGEQRYQANKFSNPNLRQSYRDYASPTDLSAVGTPDSSSTGSHSMLPQYQASNQQQFGISNALPDLSAMMFPSADPFAYPNQPMSGAYDNLAKTESFDMMGSTQGNSSPSMFQQQNNSNIRPAGNAGVFDDLEGQHFGPLPPYLAQGQPTYDFQQFGGGVSGMFVGFQDAEMPLLPGGGMMQNGGNIFTGEGEATEWGRYAM